MRLQEVSHHDQDQPGSGPLLMPSGWGEQGWGSSQALSLALQPMAPLGMQMVQTWGPKATGQPGPEHLKSQLLSHPSSKFLSAPKESKRDCD